MTADATVDYESTAALTGAVMPPRFIAAGGVGWDAPHRHLALPSVSVTPLPEAAGRAADAYRTAEPLLDLPTLARVASSAPEGGKCRTTQPRGRRQRLPGALNGKKYGRLAIEGYSTYNTKTRIT